MKVVDECLILKVYLLKIMIYNELWTVWNLENSTSKGMKFKDR